MALYTKIKGPVNYTVVGSPTISNGIASGFGTSVNENTWVGRIEVPITLNSSKKFEIGGKFTTSSNVTNAQVIFCTGKYTSFMVYNGKLYGAISSNGTSQNIRSASVIDYTINANTSYYYKYIFDGSKYYIKMSVDGITFTSIDIVSSNSSIYSTKIIYGSGGSGVNEKQNQFLGNIDLNTTYINLNNNAKFGSSVSKVKVKSGLARYTVVGSPTITNGVISNFSNSNYLTLDTPINLSATDEWELGFKIKTPTSNTNNKFLTFGTTNCKGILCYVYSTGHIWFTISTSGSSWTYDVDTGYTVTTNTDYWIKYSRKLNTSNNKYYYYIDVSTDGITYNNIYSLQNDNQIYLNNETIFIGTRGNDKSQYWRGTIYLNECYIKINGFYFWKGSKQNILGYKIKTDNLFNGYYFIEDGKLKWANPNIRLIRTGGSNDYILTNYVPNTNTVVKITHGFDSAPEVMNERYTLLWNGGHYNSSTYPDAFYYSWWRASSNTNGYASWFYVGTSGGAQSYSLTMTAGHKYELIVSGSTSVNQKLTDLESGTVLQNYNNTWSFDGSLTNTLRIFSNNTNNTVKYYIYQTKIIENNTVLHQFVPVPKGLIIGDFIVPSNGMFDIIEQKFYPNQGTGKFEIGGIPEDYIIEDGKLIWCNDNIYLKCNGAQYFDSGFKANQDTKIEVDYTSNGSGTQALYCSRNNTNTSTFTMFRPIGGGTRFDYNTSQNSISGTVSSGTRYIVIADKNECYIDGVLKFTATYSKFQSDMGMIFGCSGYGGGNLGNWSYHKYHKIQLYDNGNLIRYFLPVNTNAIIGSFTVPSPGMWDAVTQTFYPNKGTGTFTYGKDE